MQFFSYKLEITKNIFHFQNIKYIKNFNTIFLDIETTGLNQNFDFIRIIGFMFITNKLNIFQIFAKKNEDEKEILTFFYNIIKNFENTKNKNEFIDFLHEISIDNTNFNYFNKKIENKTNLKKKFYENYTDFTKLKDKNINNINFITFNGNTFDIHFINKKLIFYNISNISKFNIFTDLYKVSQNLNFKSKNLKLKTIEYLLNIKRIDSITSKKLARSYKKFDENNSNKILKNILLHNYEDVYNMYYLYEICNYLNPIEQLNYSINTNDTLNFIYNLIIKNNFITIEGIYEKKMNNFIDNINKHKIYEHFFYFEFNFIKKFFKNHNIIALDTNLFENKLKIIKIDNKFNIKNIENIIILLIKNYNI